MAIGITAVAGAAVGDNVLVGKRNAAEGTTAIVGFTAQRARSKLRRLTCPEQVKPRNVPGAS